MPKLTQLFSTVHRLVVHFRLLLCHPPDPSPRKHKLIMQETEESERERPRKSSAAFRSLGNRVPRLRRRRKSSPAFLETSRIESRVSGDLENRVPLTWERESSLRRGQIKQLDNKKKQKNDRGGEKRVYFLEKNKAPGFRGPRKSSLPFRRPRNYDHMIMSK